MEPLQVHRKKYFGQYLMVRAANMKMTVEIKTKIKNFCYSLTVLNPSKKVTKK